MDSLASFHPSPRCRLRRFDAAVVAVLLLSCGGSSSDPGIPAGGDGKYVDEPYDTLEAYGLVSIRDGAIVLAEGTVGYDLNTPLFSDYAIKERSVFLPRGTQMAYRADGVFDFPAGAVLTKSFGFPKDIRDPKSPVTWIETRLLIRTSAGWKALAYLWDDAQKSARKAPGGTLRSVEFIGSGGTTQRANYLVPSTNQCPKCHANEGVTTPIGLYPAQVHREHRYPDGTVANQITKWRELGILSGAPPSLGATPRLVAWDDPAAGTVEQRARSYIDGNCAYCHSRTGEARTSGLFLGVHETEPIRLGICKTPVAAGRAGSNLDYDIVPGQPDKSIFTYRMNSVEPSIAMPELGRSLVHTEALDLVRQWIQGLHGNCVRP